MKIARVRALEVLDSRGNPTVEAQVRLRNGAVANAQVPSGASTGRHEAHELRDGDPARFGGRGVLNAVAHVDKILGPAVEGLDATDQPALDARLIETDGSAGKSRLGANAVLAISCAFARAAAQSRAIPLWKHLSEIAGTFPKLPVPMVNIVSGGQHAGGRHGTNQHGFGHPLEFQDFLAIPRGYPDLSSALEAVVQVHREVFRALGKRGYTLNGVADEGGWGPSLKANEQGAQTLRQAIEDTGTNMDIAIDAASSQFFNSGRYQIEGQRLSSEDMIDFLEPWVNRYGVVSLEDPLAQDDWDGWVEITRRLGSRIALVGDDLFATNLDRLETGIARGAANSILVKMNQIGTLTETFAVIRRAASAGYGAVISARSGETEDSFLADLAVASGAGRIKIGSITRSERLAKYNRLLQIEKWEF
jgi:enolase